MGGFCSSASRYDLGGLCSFASRSDLGGFCHSASRGVLGGFCRVGSALCFIVFVALLYGLGGALFTPSRTGRLSRLAGNTVSDFGTILSLRFMA